MNRLLKRILIFLLLMPILCILSCALFDLNARVQREYRDSLNDSQKYVIGFVDLLGSGWKETEVIKDGEDILGWSDTWSDTIAGRSQILTSKIDDPVYVVWNQVIAYVDINSAQKAFNQQESYLSYSLTNTTFPKDQFKVFTFEHPLSFKSKTVYTKCVAFIRDTSCKGLFLYGRYVVYITVLLKLESRIYLSLDDVEKIFATMDNHMSQLVH